MLQMNRWTDRQTKWSSLTLSKKVWMRGEKLTFIVCLFDGV
jgi:hypothetical protein